MVAYTFDRFVVAASAGMSALKLRLIDTKHVGAIGTLGFGAVF